jgi:hypothetical protein
MVEGKIVHCLQVGEGTPCDGKSKPTMKRSEAAVLEQLPRMIHGANRNGAGLRVEDLFLRVTAMIRP